MPSDVQNIHWFPGHMAKTRRIIKESLKLVDIVAEIIDARIPVSSRNPELSGIIENKPRIVLLNKCDVADEKRTNHYLEQIKSSGSYAIAVDCRSGSGLNKLLPLSKVILKDKIASWKQKGMKNHPMRFMVVGIPNVGKSSFINRMVKSSKAKVADKPGVTRGNQWFTISNNAEILDTPGVLWPKIDDKEVSKKLAFTGAIKDEIIDIQELALSLIDTIKPLYLYNINERYKMIFNDRSSAYDMLTAIAKKRGFFASGRTVDYERAAVMILDEFRSGTLGRITLE